MYTYQPVVEFSGFNGDDPRGWVQRCEYYFFIYLVPEWNKMKLIVMHFKGKVQGWFHGLLVNKQQAITWQEFVTEAIL
jgi:hypothetical protein